MRLKTAKRHFDIAQKGLDTHNSHEMVLFQQPVLIILLVLGALFLFVFLFIKKFALVGNLIGIALVATFVTLSFIYKATYLEIIVPLLILALVYFALLLILNGIKKKGEGGEA